MKQSERIEEQLRCVFEKNAWHGPALMELLSDIDSKKAFNKPIKSAHSIFEIVDHVTTWIITVRRRLEGENYNPNSDEDWKEFIDKNKKGWKDTIEWLERNYNELRKTILLLEDSQLDELAVGKEYSKYFMIHGGIQHITYHAGQIALLKKMI